VNALDLDDPRLKADDLESVAMVMPTPEESMRLLGCGAELSQLRDIEQKLLPLCALNPGRLRVMKFGVAHSATYAGILERCQVIKSAAEEAQVSTQLMEFLRLALQVGNFINHGEAEMRTGMVRAFALESLQRLSSCKAGPVSALHFVCITLRSQDPGFLHSLRSGLSHTRQAAREKMSALEADISSFGSEVQFLRSRFQNLGPDEEGRDRFQTLLAAVEYEEEDLKAQLGKSSQAASDVQAYFNVAVKEGSAPPTSEQFFGHIAAILDSIQTAWREVEHNGRRWQRQFEGAGGASKADAQAAPDSTLERRQSRTRTPAAGAAASPGDGDAAPRGSTPGSPSGGGEALQVACSTPGNREAEAARGVAARPRRVRLRRSCQGEPRDGEARGSLASRRLAPSLPSTPSRPLSRSMSSSCPRSPRMFEAGAAEPRSASKPCPRSPRVLEAGAEEPGPAPKPSPGSPRAAEARAEEVARLCEFHAIHDNSDNEAPMSPLGRTSMARSLTSFADLWEFKPCPGDQAERSWDFQITGTSAYATALWRRHRHEAPEQCGRQRTL